MTEKLRVTKQTKKQKKIYIEMTKQKTDEMTQSKNDKIKSSLN